MVWFLRFWAKYNEGGLWAHILADGLPVEESNPIICLIVTHFFKNCQNGPFVIEKLSVSIKRRKTPSQYIRCDMLTKQL